jgi:hypothetical protein
MLISVSSQDNGAFAPFETGLVNTSIIEACLRSIASGAPETPRGLEKL